MKFFVSTVVFMIQDVSILNCDEKYSKLELDSTVSRHNPEKNFETEFIIIFFYFESKFLILTQINLSCQ